MKLAHILSLAQQTAVQATRRRQGLTLLAGVALCAGLHVPAHALSVQQRVMDLPDLVAGQDLWRVDYTISGALSTFDTVNLLFSPTRFGAISLLSNPSPAQLDPLLLQPDASLGTDGQLELTALQGTPAGFSAQLSVQVVNLGGHAPGPQPYEWLDADFNVRSLGTTSPVPEPATWMSAWAGLLTLLVAKGFAQAR